MDLTLESELQRAEHSCKGADRVDSPRMHEGVEFQIRKSPWNAHLDDSCSIPFDMQVDLTANPGLKKPQTSSEIYRLN